MGHAVEGFIGRRSELTVILSVYKNAFTIPLPQDFALVPMTDRLYQEMTADTVNAENEFLPDICDERFLYLSSRLFQLGRRFSLKTPVAYIETDYFGGEGFQRAVAWREGDVVFGPAVAGNEDGIQLDSLVSDPINEALQKINVQGYLMENQTEPPKDEFEELGLNRYRSSEDWIAGLRL